MTFAGYILSYLQSIPILLWYQIKNGFKTWVTQWLPPEILLVGAKGTPTDYWIFIAAEGSGDWDDEWIKATHHPHTPIIFAKFCKGRHPNEHFHFDPQP